MDGSVHAEKGEIDESRFPAQPQIRQVWRKVIDWSENTWVKRGVQRLLDRFEGAQRQSVKLNSAGETMYGSEAQGSICSKAQCSGLLLQ